MNGEPTKRGYMILSSQDDAILAESVQLMVDKGWKPQGGLTIGIVKQWHHGSQSMTDEMTFYQSMTHNMDIN